MQGSKAQEELFVLSDFSEDFDDFNESSSESSGTTLSELEDCDIFTSPQHVKRSPYSKLVQHVEEFKDDDLIQKDKVSDSIINSSTGQKKT